VVLPQPRELAAQGEATGIAPGVVVAEDAGQGQIEARQALGNGGLPVAEITHHQQGVGLEPAEQVLVVVIPLAVQVAGDGEAQHRPGRGAQRHA
jgi:hypothetical protein